MSLETAAEVDAELYGTPFLLESSVHRFKVEGCIVFVEQISCPETDAGISFFYIDSSVESAVESLAHIIPFSPVNTSGCIVIGLKHNAVDKCIRPAADGVFATDV